jgi:hypothetical protein
MKRVTFQHGILGPPNGWHYDMPAEYGGEALECVTRDGLRQLVFEEYAKYSAQAPADLLELIIQHTCEYQPDGFCQGDVESKLAKSVTLEQCYAASQTVWMRDGGPGVSDQEYVRRLAVCDACRTRKKLNGCGSCSPIVGFGRRLTGTRHSRDVWCGNWICARDNCAISIKCKCLADSFGCFSEQSD